MMTADHVDALHRAFHEIADDERAGPMAAYMKDRFTFFGIAAAPRRSAQRPVERALRDACADELIEFADRCWEQPEREFQYAAVDVLRAHASHLGGDQLAGVERLVRTKSWWDTVDLLAAHVVGSIVSAEPSLVAEMDRWIGDDDIWIARATILHQLTFAADTDADRLFGYVDRRCDDTEFFIRKAAGWALREYAKTDPAAVRAYVDDRGDRLSGLTRREALKHLR